jgi:hypothetical protein
MQLEKTLKILHRIDEIGNTKTLAFHGLDVICNVERSFCLGLHFVHCDTIGQFDQCETICEIDVEDTLETD